MKILITESRDFSAEALQELEQAGCEVDQKQCDHKELMGCVDKYDALIVRLGIKIDKDIIERGKNLKFIATLTTGVDHIEVDAAARHIKVISLCGEKKFLAGITPTAELVFAFVLNLWRQFIPAVNAVKEGQWNRDDFIGREIAGKTLGIVGLGRLGKIVGRIGRSFRAEVIFYDPHVGSRSFRRCKNLDDLAKESDIVSLHVPLTVDTTNLINERFFNKCKKSPILINTSRGAVIDELALVKAMKTRKVAGAGLDVLRDELDGNLLSNRLIQYARRHDNILITPHIGGATFDTMRKVENFIVAKLLNSL